MNIRRRTKFGVALITALFFGVLCMGMAVGFLLQVPVDLGATASLQRDVKASYVADAGLQDTMAWISFELGHSREPCTFSDPSPTRSGTLGQAQWSCTVEPDPGTPPNSLTAYRIYKLVSTASLEGKPTYRTETVVQAGQSFSRFSMFIDLDNASLYDFGISPYTKIRGPVHKNHAIRMNVSSGMYSPAGPPTETPFDGIVSTSAADNVWSGAGRPPAGKWDYVFKNGLSDLEYGVPERPLPGQSNLLANAAWGGTAPSTPPPGVSVNPTGGLYIEGDVDVMRLEVNGSGNCVIRITLGGQVTTVEEDTTNNQRILTTPDGNVTTVPNSGNGVVYANGSILDFQGENRGPHTIAVNFDTGKNIEITGRVSRRDTTVGAEPTVTDDRLGLIGNDIFIADEAKLPRNVSDPLYLYATILATNRLEVRNAGTGNPGALAIYGGYVGGQTWRVCNTYSDQRVASGYGGLAGYGTPNLFYDALLANAPPPQYPTTAGSELTVRSWKEQPL